MNVAATVSRWLERDARGAWWLDALAGAWGKASASRVRRPLELPSSARIIGVGGATLGGSGKTPLAIAVARAMAAEGRRVALVGHAYRARPLRARVVAPDDTLADVGDDALFAARELAPHGAHVVVAPTRAAALVFAANLADRVVVDGLLQTRPVPLHRSLLALDELEPWGSGRCPPSGDLRAPPAALLSAADAVVRISAQIDAAVDPGGASVSLAQLAGISVGFVSTIARPARVLRSLAARGLHPSARIELADHARPSAAVLERTAATKQRVKLWLAPAKCALNLPNRIAGAPVFVLRHPLDLPKSFMDWVLGRGVLPDAYCPSSPPQNPW